MRVQLKPNYVLTDEQESSNGQPMLVNTETGETFGLMDVFEPSESYGAMITRAAVKKMARQLTLTAEEQAFVQKFVALLPE